MSVTHKYEVPTEQLSLSGPITRPEACQLPMRGDLAHIALAQRFLVAHYVVPHLRTLAVDAALRDNSRDDANILMDLAAGTEFELLDIAGPWAWGCLGPEGPSGYVPVAALAE